MSQEVLLFGAIAVRPAVLALVNGFEEATRCTVTAKWELNPKVRKQIESGEPFDLVITNPSHVQDLAALGKIRAGSEVAFGRISMGVAAKAGSSPRDVGSVAAFKHALTSAGSVAYASEGTSGGYFTDLLERLGIADELRPRLVAVSGGHTASTVASGEADLAVVPITSILVAAPEVMLVGRFPAELQSFIDFSIGIGADAANEEQARRLSDYLMSSAVDDLLALRGLERPTPVEAPA